MGYADGSMDSIEIGNKTGIAAETMVRTIEVLNEHGLIGVVKS